MWFDIPYVSVLILCNWSVKKIINLPLLFYFSSVYTFLGHSSMQMFQWVQRLCAVLTTCLFSSGVCRSTSWQGMGAPASCRQRTVRGPNAQGRMSTSMTLCSARCYTDTTTKHNKSIWGRFSKWHSGNCCTPASMIKMLFLLPNVKILFVILALNLLSFFSLLFSFCICFSKVSIC